MRRLTIGLIAFASCTVDADRLQEHTHEDFLPLTGGTIDGNVTIRGALDTASMRSEINTDDPGTAPSIELVRTRGTASNRSVVVDGDLLGSITFTGFDDDSQYAAAQIRADVPGLAGPQNVPGRLIFSTSGSDTLREAMVITGSGRVGIGTTAPSATLDVGGYGPPVYCDGNDDLLVKNHIELWGSVYLRGPGNAILLRSPNGMVCKQIGIDDSGSLVMADVTCL